jgi:D-glycero-D-manno-heptose 1,7-bisphosphate phosphatase
MTRKAVFLDRDGVLNRSIVRNGRPYPPYSVEEFEILPGVVEATTALKNAGFLLVVVTNQPDVAAGRVTKSFVESLHKMLLNRIPIDLFKVCYCLEGNGCDCYKPRPGMLIEAARELNIDLKSSHIVGDRWRDIEAGQNAGVNTLFIDYDYSEKRPTPNYTVKSLSEAADVILGNSKRPTDAEG